VAFVSVSAFSLVFRGLADRSLHEVVARDLHTHAVVIATLLETSPAFSHEGAPGAGVDSLVKRLAPSGFRCTVLGSDGVVLGDSDRNPSLIEARRRDSSFEAALRGESRPTVRYSLADQAPRLFDAVPLRRDGVPVALVEVSLPADEDGLGLTIPWKPVFGAFLFALATAFLLSFVLARRMARPLESLRTGSARFARGDLDHRVPVEGTSEEAALASDLNRMAGQLNTYVQELEHRNREQTALLSSMAEGVLAVDAGSKLLSLNEAARELFRLGSVPTEGKRLHEVVRNPHLTRLVSSSLESGEGVEGEIQIHDRTLAANVSSLRSTSGERVGAIVVLNDVTRQRRAEKERRDLVANLSHELRTPVTAIKGFLETLQSGALGHPEDARRFVEIAHRQADRLHAMVEDLLSLARIERGVESAQVELETQPIAPVLEAALQTCEVTIRERQIHVEIDCPPDLVGPIHADLLEQAVTNLLTNAARYSEPGSNVKVRAARENGRLVIAVEDEGCGIPPEHQSRIFERFYTVDRGRSRKTGGTGLGLAIVKHVVRAHGGEVRVESRPGEGSVFTLEIPLSPSAEAQEP